ncbi:hypothetical protein [Streptomyces sp. OE57]|uniref:hypothetical protein n=1 Tax=Streptomyces lacaronensis TaxID=3379885 RepID=UPI0039B72CAB
MSNGGGFGVGQSRTAAYGRHEPDRSGWSTTLGDRVEAAVRADGQGHILQLPALPSQRSTVGT